MVKIKTEKWYTMTDQEVIEDCVDQLYSCGFKTGYAIGLGGVISGFIIATVWDNYGSTIKTFLSDKKRKIFRKG